MIGKTVVTLAASLIVGGTASAVPFLQLDASPSTYVGGAEESVQATGNPFTLYALVNSDAPEWGKVDGRFYLSAAIVPMVEWASVGGRLPPFGSFNINNSASTLNQGNLIWGVPPAEGTLSPFDSGDLPKHGIYPTYFTQLEFTLAGAQNTGLYNVQDEPGKLGSGQAGASGPLHWVSWQINIAGLEPGYAVHFDLYTTKTKDGDIDIVFKAPFSHDAVSRPTEERGGETPPLTPLPLPDGASTLTLLGVALLGLSGIRSRFGRN